MEWVEIQDRTVELAIEVALEELGLESADQVEVEVLQEPERGFLGLGGKDAIVRVKPKPKPKRSRRRRRRKGGGEGGEGGEARGGGERGGGRGGTDRRKDGGGRGKGGDRGRSPSPAKGDRKQKDRAPRGGGGARKEGRPVDEKRTQQRNSRSNKGEGDGPSADPEAQAAVIKEFLQGLLTAFGLEGEVETKVDDGAVYVDVVGEQTEALVGSKGVILQSILELCRTMVQRKTHASARIRLDIAGYNARRREALTIYAGRLAEQLLGDGGEIMLEPMNPADRKVVHDAIAAIDGVVSFSEGEEPNRSVVIALAPGTEPAADADADADADDADADADDADASETVDAPTDAEDSDEGDAGEEE